MCLELYRVSYSNYNLQFNICGINHICLTLIIRILKKIINSWFNRFRCDNNSGFIKKL